MVYSNDGRVVGLTPLGVASSIRAFGALVRWPIPVLLGAQGVAMNIPADYQLRVLNERAELDKKCRALEEFLNSGANAPHLRAQLSIMLEYLVVLDRRIKEWA